jgi:hypothetical protein
MASAEGELELRARQLEGQKLVGVVYQRGSAAGESAEHAVEHCVFLDFESGLRVAVGYDDAFGAHHGFGISVREKKVIDRAFGEVTTVTDSTAWKPHIGKTITISRIHWGNVHDDLRSSFAIGVAIHADYLRRADYPAALEIETEAGRITISAARRAADGSIIPFVNALLVALRP